jgi:hypothetical protein
MLEEPQERLAGTAQFRHFVEHQRDRVLHPPIRVLLPPVAGLDEADRRRDEEFAASRLLVSRCERALAQEIEFVLVEGTLEAKQQPIIAVSGGIDRLLIGLVTLTASRRNET